MKLRSALLALSIAASAGTAAADTTLSSGVFNGTLSLFGYSANSTFGQVFTAPAVDNVITDFSFIVISNPEVTGVSAYIYAWDGTKATGPALFTSSPFTLVGDYQRFQINTGGVALTSGSQYVAFVSVSAGPGGTGTASFGASFPGRLGGFVYQSNGSNFGALFTTSWTGVGFDSAFTANFIPAPGAAGLLGLAGLAAARRRR